MPRENKRTRRLKPSKFTPEIARKVCAKIAAGSTIEEAAKASGVHRDTVYDWKATRETFAAQVEAAKERRLDVLEERWAKATNRDWRAAQAMLKALRSKKFAERFVVQLDSEVEHIMRALTEALADDPVKLERALSAIAGRPHRATGAREASGDESGSDAAGGEAIHSPLAIGAAAGVSKPRG